MANAYINGAPHQSLKARYPGISLAATDLGVTRSHLWNWDDDAPVCTAFFAREAVISITCI